MNIQSTASDFSQKNQLPHILIVDDQPDNLEVLHRFLDIGYHITEASNGLQALELLDQEQFDLVILDIMMPGMNGIEVLQHLRQTVSSTDLPVILVSALDDRRDIVNGIEAGANDYIPKPLDVAVVRARVKSQIQVKEAFAVQKQALDEMEKINLLKNKLLGIASHDLKSPLSNIFMAESLLRHLTDINDPTILAILNTMKSTLNMMNDIIVEFLDIAAIQNGKVSVALETVNLCDIIDKVIEQYDLQSQEKGSIVYALDCEGFVLADPNRLKQILSNFVSNALKYSPPNSEIKLNVVTHEQSCVIEIIDQGPGIPNHERELLFTEFGKLSPRPTGAESSTGLGLWIVKQMVELMDGEVGVTCPDSGGSIFWVKLPTPD